MPGVYDIVEHDNVARVAGADLGEEEEILVIRLQSGDRAAFDCAARRFAPRLLRLANRMLADGAEAADVVQDVFAKMLANPKAIAPGSKLENSGALEAWLIVVTLNQCRSRRRSMFRALRKLRNFALDVPGEVFVQPTIENETHERVRETVAKLPVRDREVIVLHYLEEMPVKRIAGILNIRENAVEVRLHRARAKLKERLKAVVDHER